MRLCRHTLAIILGGVLLLPLAAWAQKGSSKPGQQPASKPAGSQADQQAQPKDGENPGAAGASEDEGATTEETPIEPVLSGPYPVMSRAVMDRGRQIFQMFDQGNLKGLWNSLSAGRKAGMVRRRRQGTPAPTEAQVEEKFVAVYRKIRERAGNELSMMGENITPYPLAPDTIYSRLSRLSGAQTPVMFTITLNQKGQVDGFDLKPLPEHIAEGKYAGYSDTNKLKLPFSDQWLVLQGGRSLFDNFGAGNDESRFAYDFAYLKNGQLFSGPGGPKVKNSDYYCFGQPILAPADGEVTRAIGGYDDSPPGRPLGDPQDGNSVIISHGDGESSMINHLKQNSLKVKRGDKVKQGDVIGECGNSGSGVIPHVHYQLQKRAGTTLPAQFVDYIADGKPVDSGEPKKGQLVKNGTASAAATSAPADKPAASTDKAKVQPATKPAH
jgi:hypothetical protein